MTRATWRTMACLLAVGLGGIVVWADDPPAAPKPAKPSDPPKSYEREANRTASATPPEPAVIAANEPVPPSPIVFEKPKNEVPPPPVQTVAAPQVIIPSPTTPTMPTIMEPLTPPDMKLVPPLPPAPPPVAVVPPPPAATIAPPPPMVVPPCSEKGCFDKPEIVRAEPDPPTKLLTPLPPPTAPVAPPLPMIEIARTTPPAPAPMPSAAVTPMPHTLSPFPWKMCLEFVNNVTQFELRRGDEMLLRVQCEKLDLSTPSAGLHASGKVVVSGPCLEARCEKISIAWNSGQVALDGSVYLSFQNKGVVQVMRAESLCFRLTGANVPVEFTARDVHQMVGTRQ